MSDDGDNVAYELMADVRLPREVAYGGTLAGWQEADQTLLTRLLGLVCEQGAVIVLSIEAGGEGRHRLEFEAILLPLLHTGNTVGRVIGAMSLITPMPVLGTERPLARRLLKHEVIWQDGRPHSVIERSGGTAPFQAAPLATHQPAADTVTKSERPRLRVLEGGRTFWKPGGR